MDENNLSPRQRSVLSVLRAGKQAELDEYVESKVKSTAGRYADVLRDSDRSDSWKAERVAEIERQAYDEFDREVTRLGTSGRSDINADFAKVFGTAGIPGDAASLAISRRDAGDRVASIGNADDLLALLARADQSGDEALARAVAERAHDIGAGPVLERFVESRPELREPAERLWKRRGRKDQEMNYLMNLSMRLSTFKAAYAPAPRGVAMRVR